MRRTGATGGLRGRRAPIGSRVAEAGSDAARASRLWPPIEPRRVHPPLSSIAGVFAPESPGRRRSQVLRLERPSLSSTGVHLMDILKDADPEVFAAITAEEHRQRDELELIASENYTSARGDGGGRLGPDEQVRRGASRPALLRRLRVSSTRPSSWRSTGPRSSSAPSTPTSSRTRGPRPTRRSTSPRWRSATPSWRWTWPRAAT